MLDTGSNPTDVFNIECENTSWLPLFAPQYSVSADDVIFKRGSLVVAVIVRWLIMRRMWYVFKPLYRLYIEV